MEEARGFIEKILFSNEANGYKVLTVVDKDDPDSEAYLVGIMPFVSEGEFIIAKGNIVEHPKYGVQLQVVEYEIQQLTELKSIEKYLASGAIKGIGPAMAAKIVKEFGEDTFRVIEEEPELLVKIKGISERIARDIAVQVASKYELRRATMFLQEYGISVNMAVKIFGQYGNKIYEIIKENPYKLAEDIDGIGFKRADEIAHMSGISRDSEFRIECAITYILMQASQNGHVYLPEDKLINSLNELLEGQIEDLNTHLKNMVFDKKIAVREEDGVRNIYSRAFYNMERAVAHKLIELNLKESYDEKKAEGNINLVERLGNIKLDPVQKEAIIQTIANQLTVITGGPGTGKTTTINSIIKYYELLDYEIRLAAPTGRATKRLSEATGYEASTIHRLLEINGAIGTFERNADNPIEADLIVIDEMSMVDIVLMNALLKAITPGTKLILVGDVNQLPSVGPGRVLKDIIESKNFHVVELTKIFRQAGESDIVTNAHKINNGEKVDLKKPSKDFLFINRDNPDKIISAMLTLLTDKLPKYVNAGIYDIQVLTPMKKGRLGIENLNKIFQHYINPQSDKKKEIATANGIFREGDKVMQIKNDYNLLWETRSRYGIAKTSGSGVFNGDIGIIKKVNTFTETLEIEFDDGRFVDYPFKQLEDLELAYAITVHKSQGSEYPAIIIPSYPGPAPLMNRNLLYTAVTRAKNCVCLVGFEDVIHTMTENISEQKRYSSLDKRIIEAGKEGL